MPEITFPVFLLFCFLVINLVVGFAKGSEVKTVADFALGDKNFGTATLTATLLATQIGAAAIYGTAHGLVSIGIIALAGIVFYSISCFVRSWLITNQISRFNNCISFGDFIGQTYGEKAKGFCGFLTGGYCILNVSLQIQVLGSIFKDFFGINFFQAIIFSSGIISIYTAFGGMRSVVATDILQLLFIIFTLFVLTYYTMIKHSATNFNAISNPKVLNHFFSSKALFSEYLLTRTVLFLFLTNLAVAPCFQRLLLAKNREAAKKMYLYTGIGYIIVGVFLFIIIFFSVAFLGDKLNVKNPLNFIIKTFIPAKIIPFIGLGLVAVIFSTADSYLHATGLCLSKDFLEPLIKRDIKLIEVRIITFLAGCISMAIVLWFNGLLYIKSIKYLEAPILVVPVLYGFLGFKSSNKMFWISAIVGVLGLFIAGSIPSIQSFRVIIGCFTSLIAYFAVHCYENKGFKFVGNPILPYRVKNLKK